MIKHIADRVTPATCLVGIEYAHIYSDQQFSMQHELGIMELHRLTVGPDIKKIVLVDDYSPALSSQCFDMHGFLQKLSQNNADPDVVVFESKLVPYCAAVLDLITSKNLKRELSSYYRSRSKYPCSLFVAAWYLLRLGAFGTPRIECATGSSEHLYTDRIITILPDSFMTPEARALKVIESTNSSTLRKNIEHVFFAHQETSYSDFEDLTYTSTSTSNGNCGRKIRSEDRQTIEFITSAPE